MQEKYDIRAFGLNMPYPPTQAYDRIASIKDNKKYLKAGYNTNALSSTLTNKPSNTVKVKVLGKVYEETMYESHLYSLIIKRLLALHLNLKPVITYRNEEITLHPHIWGKYGQLFEEVIPLGHGYLYVYLKGSQIVVNILPFESVYKIYENGEFKKYLVGEYIHADDDIFKEKDPVRLKQTVVGDGYVEESIYEYDSKQQKTGKRVGNVEHHKTGLKGHNLIEFKNGVHGLSDFEGYRQTIVLYEKALSSINILLQVGLSPIIEVPMGSLPTTADGSVESPLMPGGVIENNGQNPIRTIGLDLKIEDLQKQKDSLLNDVAIQSELGALLKADFGGSNISADGLKIMLKSALDKSSRICDYMTSPLTELVGIILQLKGYKDVVLDDIEIKWRDGINKLASEVEVQE